MSKNQLNKLKAQSSQAIRRSQSLIKGSKAMISKWKTKLTASSS